MSQSIDINRSINPAISLAPAARTATANGTAVDMAGYVECAAVLVTGIRTDGTTVIKLQDSPDNVTFTDIPAAQLSGAFAADVVSTTVVKVGVLSSARYIRAVTTVSGATTGAVYSVVLIQAGARVEPK